MSNFWKTFTATLAIILIAGSLMVSTQKAHAFVVQHGATIAKGCNDPKIPGNTTDCEFTVGYNDSAGDTISVDEAWDVEDFGGDNVRVPAVGNLPIVAVTGNTTCTVAGALPCKIGKSGSILSGLPGTAGNGSVTFGSNTYVIQTNDPDPLPDQANSKVHDLCDDPNTFGCDGSSNTLQFTSSTNLKYNPTVNSEVHNASHTVITSVPLGTTVHDKAIITGSAGIPNGTVDFARYSNGNCEGDAAATQNNVALALDGTAESISFVTASVGSIAYKVHYDGGTNYISGDGPCEPLAIEKLIPTVRTEVHDLAHTDITNTTVNAGTVVHDKAFVAGSGPNPGGTVDFKRFTNGTCTGIPANTQSSVGLSNANPALAESSNFTTVAGAMSYLVHYNGDANYKSADGVCEPLTVQEVPQGCTLTQGYWKNHPVAWPVSSLTLGTVPYTKVQLLTILKTPVKGNGLISLSHQLIAAKLNIASGASSASIASAIASADTLIGNKVVPPVGSGFLSPSSTSSLTSVLDNFNSGTTGPGHCSE